MKKGACAQGDRTNQETVGKTNLEVAKRKADPGGFEPKTFYPEDVALTMMLLAPLIWGMWSPYIWSIWSVQEEAKRKERLRTEGTGKGKKERKQEETDRKGKKEKKREEGEGNR